MTRKAITIIVTGSDSGAAYFWEVRDRDGGILADSTSFGEFGTFASEASAFADACKFASGRLPRL